MRQSEILKQLSDEQLTKQLYLSQLLFLLLGFGLSMFFFDSLFDWLNLFSWDIKEIAYYGILSGFIIVIIDLFLTFVLPEHVFDDGGINERIFKNRSVLSIFSIALVVAICEEVLFRGFIQTTFGYIFASTLFVVVHIRYLKKPVLLLAIIFVSFYIGYLFEITENLLVTITTHFIVDFLLGLFVKYYK